MTPALSPADPPSASMRSAIGSSVPKEEDVSISRARIGRAAIGLAIVALVGAGCSAGASSSPASAVLAATASPAAPSASAAASSMASASPVAPAVASASAGAPDAGYGGGRYGSGGDKASSSPASGVVLSMATTSLGPVLTGPNGLTLYTHKGDTATSSTCTGGCAAAWPPLTVAAGGRPTAAAGVLGTPGTLKRADGTTQVTYNGLPLYGWQSDAKPGDTTGEGVGGFSVAKP